MVYAMCPVQFNVVLNGFIYFDLCVDGYLKDKQCPSGIQSDRHEFDFALNVNWQREYVEWLTHHE